MTDRILTAARPHQRRRAVDALVVAGLATVLVLLGLTPTASAGDRAGHAHEGARPTVVLVHGAWADGSSWNKVVKRLQADGYPVRVPPNPLRSLPQDSEGVADFLATIDGPVVLVGHSYGGAVITNAATHAGNVRALVYVDAFAPDEGQTVFPLAGAGSALAVDPTTIFDFVPYPGAPAGDADLYLQHETFLQSFATGVPRRQAELLYATQRPIAFSAGNEASGPPAFDTLPSWYLLGTQDRIITPAAQLAMAQNAGAAITRVKAGHLSLVSAPGAVTRLIEQAARTTG
jgi:pimeloyl-ACP methyl ester carboxylesterase